MTLATNCPFCGGANLVVARKKRPLVRCRDCHGSGPAANTPWQAVARWNDRRGSATRAPVIDVPAGEACTS